MREMGSGVRWVGEKGMGREMGWGGRIVQVES